MLSLKSRNFEIYVYKFTFAPIRRCTKIILVSVVLRQKFLTHNVNFRQYWCMLIEICVVCNVRRTKINVEILTKTICAITQTQCGRFAPKTHNKRSNEQQKIKTMHRTIIIYNIGKHVKMMKRQTDEVLQTSYSHQNRKCVVNAKLTITLPAPSKKYEFSNGNVRFPFIY